MCRIFKKHFDVITYQYDVSVLYNSNITFYIVYVDFVLELNSPHSLTDASWRLKLKTKIPTLKPRPFKYISNITLCRHFYLALHSVLLYVIIFCFVIYHCTFNRELNFNGYVL